MDTGNFEAQGGAVVMLDADIYNPFTDYLASSVADRVREAGQRTSVISMKASKAINARRKVMVRNHPPGESAILTIIAEWVRWVHSEVLRALGEGYVIITPVSPLLDIELFCRSESEFDFFCDAFERHVGIIPECLVALPFYPNTERRLEFPRTDKHEVALKFLRDRYRHTLYEPEKTWKCLEWEDSLEEQADRITQISRLATLEVTN